MKNCGFFIISKERYSVRKMKPERVKQEDLNKILEAARLSPTAKNMRGPAIFMYCIIAITLITSIICFTLYYKNIIEV